MIPSQNIVAWANVVPWAEPRQVEQDLIISRSLVEMFSEPSLCDALRFRGGTALNKLHLPAPLRYSEDIDLVRTSKGPIGPIIDRLRATLEPWLGSAQFTQSPVAPKLRLRADSEDGSGVPICLKIEISTPRKPSLRPGRRKAVVRRPSRHRRVLARGDVGNEAQAVVAEEQGNATCSIWRRASPPSDRWTSAPRSRYSAAT